MGLNKYRLGDFLEIVSLKCGISKCHDVSGININKNFMPSRNVGEDTSKYLLVPPKHFACNLMHVGRDERIPISCNYSDKNKVVSPAYEVFKMIENGSISLDYLNILIQCFEFDRFAWFSTDSSVRGNLDWDRFCDIEITLPTIEIQQKYIAVYNAMKANQESYEKGLDDLKLTCDAYIERLLLELRHQKIGTYIEQCEEKNKNLHYGLECVKGISTNKSFIQTKAILEGVSLTSYKIVYPNCFAYVADTSRRGNKISLAFNANKEKYLVSLISTVFKTKDGSLLAEYLFMYFNRSEFDRYARFHSWGSAREVFSWKDLCEMKIPIPSMEIQQSIVNIYHAYNERKTINERLKAQIKNICPILIKGSLEEGRG